MTLKSLLIILAIGAVAGWIAGEIVTGAGLGLFGNIIVGILGSFVGSYVLPLLGVHVGTGLVPYIFNAAVGGIVILLVASLIRWV